LKYSVDLLPLVVFLMAKEAIDILPVCCGRLSPEADMAGTAAVEIAEDVNTVGIHGAGACQDV
jgi:hypothetical protein